LIQRQTVRIRFLGFDSCQQNTPSIFAGSPRSLPPLPVTSSVALLASCVGEAMAETTAHGAAKKIALAKLRKRMKQYVAF
jgi:hypothetical protein